MGSHVARRNDHPRVDTLLLRRTFPELETSLLSYFRRDVPRDVVTPASNDSKHIVTWLNGSTTRFGYSAGESDIFQYQGAEFLFIGIDELTLFTLGRVAISDPPAVIAARMPGMCQAEHGRRQQSRQRGPRLGESAVGGPARRARHGPPRAVRRARL